jgi:hypothetical protein
MADDIRYLEGLNPIMEDALVYCWELLSDSLFESLVKGILKRIEAVIKARDGAQNINFIILFFTLVHFIHLKI